MKLGVLTPRYGEEVVGGAEYAVRALSEHMVAIKGWTVEAFTTCAKSAATWADEYEPGQTEIAGVTVHRHPSVSGRNPEYLHMLPQLRRDPGGLSPGEVERLVGLVGPVCPGAVDQAVEAGCDLVAVTPYLFWPTLAALPRLGRRAVFHAAAHDEPELHMPVMQEVFPAVGGFSYNTFAERALVEGTFPVGHLPSRVVGSAVVAGTGDREAARGALGLEPDEPFVLCVGRVERAKGAEVLASMWELYRRRRPRAPRLVFVGPVAGDAAAFPGVILAGRQPEEVKWGALAACSFLVAPSGLESFSLVVLEGWLSGRPVLVNGRCSSTVEHCRRSGGGLWFEEYADFEVATDLLLGDENLCRELAAAGASYTRRTFAWPRIVDRYEQLAFAILDRWAQ